MEYVSLDLETTGLDPRWDRVIEVGAVAFTLDQVLSKLERLADPGRTVPEAVLRLTGVRRQQVAGGPPGQEVLGQLAEFLRGRQPIGHGARLEVGFLKAAGLWPQDAEGPCTLRHAPHLL